MILNILNNKSTWKLIALMSYSPGSGYSRQEIKELLEWNNLTLDRALKKLKFYKIIKQKNRILKLNYSNEETQQLLYLINKEKEKLNYPELNLFIILSDFLNEIEYLTINSAYLFGSYAKKTASIHSDIDFAIFSDEKINTIKIKDKLEQKYNKKIQIHNITKKDKLTKEILKHGIKLA